jgi:hypothetical protein
MRFSSMLVSSALALAALNDATATAQPFICHLCSDQKFPGKPKGGVVMLQEVVQMAKPIYTCEELYYLGLEGGITDRICMPLVVSMKEHCQCDEFNVGPPDNIWTARSPNGDNAAQWKLPWAHWDVPPPSVIAPSSTATPPFVSPASFPDGGFAPPPKPPTTTQWAPAPTNVWPPKPFTPTTTTTTSWNAWPHGPAPTTMTTSANSNNSWTATPPVLWPSPWNYFSLRAEESPIASSEEKKLLSLTPTIELPPIGLEPVALQPKALQPIVEWKPTLIQPPTGLPSSRPSFVLPPISLAPVGLKPSPPTFILPPIALVPVPTNDRPPTRPRPPAGAATSAPVVAPAVPPQVPTAGHGGGNNNPMNNMKNNMKKGQMTPVRNMKKMNNNRPMMTMNMKKMNDKDTGKGRGLRGHLSA